MAKPKQAGDSGAGKVKIRVIEFEIEGNDTTMQESLKSITAALNRGMTSQPPARQVRYVPTPAPVDEEVQPSDEASEEDVDVEDAPVPQRRPAAPKKVPTPKLLDIKFNTASPTLKEFMDEKHPTSVIQRYLVIAYWYKHYLQIEDLTADHFFTAFRHLGLQVPRDPGAPIKDLRHKRRTQMGAGSAAGTAAINHIGENIVEAMGKGE